MSKKNTATNIPAPIELDFGFQLAEEPSFLIRQHGGGGGRTAAPLPDAASTSVEAWKADWKGRATGDAALCRAAMLAGTTWPDAASKYADRGAFLSRFAKPGSSVARAIGDGPVVLEGADGNVRVIGYWTFRQIGGEDPAVVEEAVGAPKDGVEVTRRVRAAKAEQYTVAVRLATAKGDVVAVADVPHGAFVLPSMIRKDSIQAAK